MHHGLASRGPAHTKKLGSSRPLLAAVSSTISCKTKVHKSTKYRVYNSVSISQTQRCKSNLQINHATGNRQPVIYSNHKWPPAVGSQVAPRRKGPSSKEGHRRSNTSTMVSPSACDQMLNQGSEMWVSLDGETQLEQIGAKFLACFFLGFPVKTMPFGSCQYEVFLEVQKICNIYTRVLRVTSGRVWSRKRSTSCQ